jgi:hypothetical protein
MSNSSVREVAGRVASTVPRCRELPRAAVGPSFPRRGGSSLVARRAHNPKVADRNLL